MSTPTTVRFRGALYVTAKKHPRQEYEELSRMGKNIFWSSLLFKEGGEELVRYSLNMGKTYDDKPRERESSSIDNDQPSTGESVNAPLYPPEIPTMHRASSPKYIRFRGALYCAVGASHPNVDTDGTPISDLKPKDKKEQSIVQESLDESREMYFEQKGGDKKRPKEKGINPDYGDSHPGFGAGGPGDGGDGGGGNGGGNGGGGE